MSADLRFIVTAADGHAARTCGRGRRQCAGTEGGLSGLRRHRDEAEDRPFRSPFSLSTARKLQHALFTPSPVVMPLVEISSRGRDRRSSVSPQGDLEDVSKVAFD